ncbi:MAG: hypothetical protein EHM46_00245 [Bacteroidetes bacterium]|nr:MAG: hypothetical protein EHM46_00245 [Bacteroidota bacterium]
MHREKGFTSGILCLAIPFFCLLLSHRILAISPGPSREDLHSREGRLLPDTLPSVRITLAPQNRTINQVLDEISLQTGYNFTYNAELIQGREKTRFGVRNLPLELALDSLLGDPGLDYRLIDRNIVIYRKNETAPGPISESIDRTILTGRVVDGKTGKPLEFATIALFGTTLGSITNQAGGFSFKIPAGLDDPLLVVSYIGYKSHYLPVTYPLPGEVTIGLEKEVIPLQEVIIRYSDPVLLLQEALNRIPLVYLDEPAAMTAFYREAVRRNQHFMVYSEAVLQVAKTSYENLMAGDRVRIRKGRKITDIASSDTVVVKLGSGIHTSLGLDVVKNRPDFLQEDFVDRYDLEFTDMVTYNDRLVYVISFHQKENIGALLFQGQIYLDQETLALVAVDFEYNPDLIHREPDLFLISRAPHIHIRPEFGRYHVDYRQTGVRYHLSQVRAEVGMKVRKRRQWIGARYHLTLEMAVTDINPGERLQISPSERVRPAQVLADQPFESDPLFWGIYNTIRPEATLMESINRIEENLQEINGQ